MAQITKKALYQSVIANIDTMDFNEEFKKADVVEFCEGLIATLESEAAKSKARRDAKKGEDTFAPVLLSVLTNEPQTINEILAQIDGDVTSSKVSATASKLIAAGKATKVTVEIENESGKATRVAYKLA